MVQLKRGQLNVIITDSAGEIKYHFDPLNPEAQLSYLKLSNLTSNHDLLNPESQQNIEPLTCKGTQLHRFPGPRPDRIGRDHFMHVGDQLQHHRTQVEKTAAEDGRHPDEEIKFPDCDDDRKDR